NRLALHDRQRRARADVAESEYRRSVADHRHEPVRPRVPLRESRLLLDGAADLRYPGGVGDGQVTGLRDGAGGRHGEFAALVSAEDVVVAHLSLGHVYLQG